MWNSADRKSGQAIAMNRQGRPSSSLINRAVRSFQSVIRRYYWRMDIHASVRIAASAYIDRTWPSGVHIGEATIIGEEVVILTHDMTRGLYLDTRIGKDCYIGPRAIVLPGLEIGDHCVIEAGAVVTKSVPCRSRALGNPAVISARSSGECR